MIDDALRANPAARADATTGHGHLTAAPASGPRRLTADAFRALTLRLKAPGSPGPLAATTKINESCPPGPPSKPGEAEENRQKEDGGDVETNSLKFPFLAGQAQAEPVAGLASELAATGEATDIQTTPDGEHEIAETLHVALEPLPGIVEFTPAEEPAPAGKLTPALLAEPAGPAPASSARPDGGVEPPALQEMLRQLDGQFGGIARTAEREDADRAAEPATDDFATGARHVLEHEEVEGVDGPVVQDKQTIGITAVDGERPRAREDQAEEEAAATPETPLMSDEMPLADKDLSAILGHLSEKFEPGGVSGDADRAQETASTASDADPASPTSHDAGPVPDESSGETSRLLLDIMSMPSSALQPQERGLAADTLLRLLARMPAKDVMALAERVCMMETPPGLIIKELIGHSSEEVAALVLEKCSSVTDQDLLELIAHGSLGKLRMVARRRHVSSALIDALMSKGDASVFLTIVRNPGAEISYDAFIELCEQAKNQPSLQAPLATRANTPAPVAFELFWFLPSELRRYVLSRFLTDSETLGKILKITLAVDASAGTPVTERKFPERARIEELVGLIEEGLTPEASRLMASLSGVCEACARRLIADPDGEPLTIVMKAMGATRALFSATLERWQASTSAMLRTDRNLDELRNLFDSMSFNKARVLLTYWDWAARNSGPYARRAA
jgi:hypothetical protein